MDVLESTPNSVRGDACGRLSNEDQKDEINTSFINLLEVSTTYYPFIFSKKTYCRLKQVIYCCRMMQIISNLYPCILRKLQLLVMRYAGSFLKVLLYFQLVLYCFLIQLQIKYYYGCFMSLIII